MKHPKVDYDRLANSYNQRFEHDPSTGIIQTLHELTHYIGAERILEAGCGTGKFLSHLSTQVKAAIGLDLSSGMITQARQRQPPMHLVQGRAGHLPFARGCFDLIFCVNAIHHFDEPQRFVQAAFDGIYPGGLLAVIGSDPHAGSHHWYVHDYFEGVLETDLARFPPHTQILRWMEEVGLQNLERREIEHIHDEHRGRSVLEDPFLQKEATSQLALLGREAYQAGLDRIRSEIEKAEAIGQEMVFQADLRIFLLSGLKPA